MQFHFLIFAFVALAQGDTSKNLLLRPMSESTLPVSFQKFKISSLTFKSMIYIEFIFVYGVINWSRMGQGSPGHAVPGLPWGDGYSWCGPGQCGTLGQPDKLATLPGLCSHWHYQGRGGLQNIVFLGISNSGENSSSSLPTWHPFTTVNKWTQCTCSSEAFKPLFFTVPRVAESAHKSLSYIPSSCRLKAAGQGSH